MQSKEMDKRQRRETVKGEKVELIDTICILQ